jgi:hypothetical protein
VRSISETQASIWSGGNDGLGEGVTVGDWVDVIFEVKLRVGVKVGVEEGLKTTAGIVTDGIGRMAVLSPATSS